MTTRDGFTTKLVAGAVCGALMATLIASRGAVSAQSGNGCSNLPSQSDLRAALSAARGVGNGGFDLDMWGTLVNRDGIVCAVAFTGADRGDPMAGQPRDLGAEGEHRERVQPAGPRALHRQPLCGRAARRQPVRPAGQQSGRHRRGVRRHPANVRHSRTIRWSAARSAASTSSAAAWRCTTRRTSWSAAIGVSGDTSCADHNIAWRTRHALNLDYVPGGVGAGGARRQHQLSGVGAVPSLANDFSHPICKIAGVDGVSAISAALPVTQ